MRIMPSACLKIGLTLLSESCVITKKLISPTEWNFTYRLLRRILVSLAAFYLFTVTRNIKAVAFEFG
jgi:hypothetical protein